jgi:hypothetical protein
MNIKSIFGCDDVQLIFYKSIDADFWHEKLMIEISKKVSNKCFVLWFHFSEDFFLNERYKQLDDLSVQPFTNLCYFPIVL